MMISDPAEAVWLRSLANSERRRLQSAQTPGMNTEPLCSMNYGCNTVSAANAAAELLASGGAAASPPPRASAGCCCAAGCCARTRCRRWCSAARAENIMH